jgi:peroxiredoxin
MSSLLRCNIQRIAGTSSCLRQHARPRSNGEDFPPRFSTLAVIRFRWTSLESNRTIIFVNKMTAPEARGGHFHSRQTTNSASPWPRMLLCRAVICALIIAAFVTPANAETNSVELTQWTAGEKPAFMLRDVEGKDFRLATLRGRTVIMHFFATWCEPCREELPALCRLVDRGKDRRVSIIAISVAEVPERVRRFLEKLPVNFPVLLDEDRVVTKSWGIKILPSTVVLDTKLRPRLVVERDMEWDKLDLGRLVARISAAKPTS